jgi:hypothetical protein
VALHAFDHDRTRHAVRDLPEGLAVNVGMIPIEPGRMVGRHAYHVMQRLTRMREHRQTIVTRRQGRDGQPMEMQVDVVAAGGLRVHAIVQRDLDALARFEPDRRRHALAPREREGRRPVFR